MNKLNFYSLPVYLHLRDRLFFLSSLFFPVVLQHQVDLKHNLYISIIQFSPAQKILSDKFIGINEQFFVTKSFIFKFIDFIIILAKIQYIRANIILYLQKKNESTIKIIIINN